MLDEEGAEPAADDQLEGAEGVEEVVEDSDDAPEAEESADATETVETPATRGPSRVQRLANEARQEREARIAAEAEVKAFREARSTPSVDHEEARRQAERLALMDPQERKFFEQEQTIKRLQEGQQLTQLQMQDYADKATYDAKVTVNPVYAKHKDWVENALTSERKAGRNPSRELLLRIKIGDDALASKPSKSAAREKENAAVRVGSAKGAPISARGDAGAKKAGKGDSVDDLYERLKGVPI